VLALLTRLFPVWAAVMALIAYSAPSAFLGFKPHIAQLLMLIMFAMGVTLRVADFSRVLQRPAPQIKRVERLLPLVSMVAILLVLSTVVALSRDRIATVGGVVLAGVIAHNLIGYLGGYWGGRLLGFDKSVCRTLAIEVGMQNSGLAASLGAKFFSPMAALPGAIFSVWHNISGSLLAGYWSSRPTGTANDHVRREDVSLH
jgi:BASS family bile acid:Na+ symporter